MKPTYEQLEQQVLEQAVQLANAESKCRELVAENHTARNAVQVFCDVVGENTDVICEEVGQDGVKATLAAMCATGNMPATDAFLAEVRASVIDDAKGMFKNSSVMVYSESVVEELSQFAAQLRKGAAL